MITYTEKGRYLHEALAAAGYVLKQIDGTWASSDDTAVQLIIDAYDSLPEAKVDAINRVKQHAAGLVNAIYPHIDAESTDVIGFYNYTVDMWQGGALTGRLLDFKGVRDTTVSKISEINAMTDWALVDAYDATVGW